MKPTRLHIAAVAIVALVAACCGSKCRDRRAADFSAVPETLEVDGSRLYLVTYLWRDYQPVAPPDGQPLAANVRLMTVAGDPAPEGLAVDRFWVVNGTQRWEAVPRSDAPMEEPGSMSWLTERTVHDGPRWGPGIAVDVVARVVRGDSTWLVQARAQTINRTD
jgi:hypothetical protein